MYASVGGKPRLLAELITSGIGDARLREATGRIATGTDPVEVVADYVAGVRLAVREYGDIAELVLATAHVDATVAKTAALAEEDFRRELTAVANRLRDLGALVGSVDDAVDVLAYYLGYSSWRRLVLDFGWNHDKAQAWLTERITDALVTP